MKKVAIAISAKPDIDLNSVIEKSASADSIHVDIIDRGFADNLAVDIDTIRKLREITKLPIDTHIMSRKPSMYFASSEFSDMIIFHYEIDEIIEDVIKQLDDIGVKKGIAINPETDIGSIKNYLNALDAIQVMGVNPGFSGQKLLPETIEKAKELYRMKNDYNFEVIFDGGVTIENAKLITADVIVSGSTILNSPEPRKTIELLR